MCVKAIGLMTHINCHQLDLWKHRCNSASPQTEVFLGSPNARAGVSASCYLWGLMVPGGRSQHHLVPLFQSHLESRW